MLDNILARKTGLSTPIFKVGAFARRASCPYPMLLWNIGGPLGVDFLFDSLRSLRVRSRRVRAFGWAARQAACNTRPKSEIHAFNVEAESILSGAAEKSAAQSKDAIPFPIQKPGLPAYPTAQLHSAFRTQPSAVSCLFA